MIVFEYLYSMMTVFGPKMNNYAMGEVRIIDNEDDDKVSNDCVYWGNCYTQLYIRMSLKIMYHLIMPLELWYCL